MDFSVFNLRLSIQQRAEILMKTIDTEVNSCLKNGHLEAPPLHDFIDNLNETLMTYWSSTTIDGFSLLNDSGAGSLTLKVIDHEKVIKTKTYQIGG